MSEESLIVCHAEVRQMLDRREGDNLGVKANLAHVRGIGKLGGAGGVMVLPVDQGFEHKNGD